MPTSPDDNDRYYMRRCLDLARSAMGNTAPNPMVGCVIVKDGKIIGEGYHPKAGEPHAEIFALRSANQTHEAQTDKATLSATLYVNLEPCNHTGLTPPCSDAVIASGVSRVVVGMVDPNPKVAGSGIAKIKAAGIAVTVGVEEDACQTLNEAFVHRILNQRPFGILKYAMTIDGKIATTTGHSAWITSPDSRRWVYQLRSYCQAIIIGGNTVRKDNPNLTCHGVSDRIPLRVVMSRSLDLPTVANLWNCDQAPTVVFTQPNPNRDIHNALTRQGVEIIELEVLTPDSVMKNLYDRGQAQVLWECGGTLAARALQDNSVQKLYAFIAPKIIGGASAPTPIGDLGLTEMTQAIELKKLGLQSIGPDWLLDAYL
ncbi:MAG: bifunctional diaminohydroxyphosphoribosylaminopyrimidine deaminase/5-amino-6-(5-phosphoribosylamino)uracil reductase RibD [Alkalinema sp. CAN_BIN05]|nr:bifunctional diaminohydroxyphosphoribosylaminopyrimidine deaminase/5-amino-6-(5-phosphoribosylamino)uracil reductase RibD [Alkalinema sp. CAN_BIN05]